MELVHHFAIVLKQHRKSRGMTQDRLAELIDMDRTYVSMLERSKRYPSLETVMKIGKALDISASEILRDLENRTPIDATNNAEGSIDDNKPVDTRRLLSE